MSIGRSVNVYVKNVVDQKPIAGAQVSSTYDFGDPVPFGSGITDVNGLCRLFVTGNGYYMNITVQANHYLPLTHRIFHSGEQDLLFLLSPLPDEIVTYETKLFAIDDMMHRLQNVKVTIGGVSCSTNIKGEVRFFLESGGHAVSVEGNGVYFSGFPPWPTVVEIIPFTATINVSKNATYTLAVDEQLIIGGNPPPIPGDQNTGDGSFWDWLLKWGPYLVVGTVVVGVAGYFMTSVSRVVRAVKPNNGEREQYE